LSVLWVMVRIIQLSASTKPGADEKSSCCGIGYGSCCGIWSNEGRRPSLQNLGAGHSPPPRPIPIASEIRDQRCRSIKTLQSALTAPQA
jgi:hypothetical protein